MTKQVEHTFHDDPEALRCSLENVVASADTLHLAKLFQHYIYLKYGKRTKIVDTESSKS